MASFCGKDLLRRRLHADSGHPEHFTEYLYHRVAATRTITLLIAIIETATDEVLKELDSKLSEEIPVGCGRDSESQFLENPIARFLRKSWVFFRRWAASEFLDWGFPNRWTVE